MDRLKKKCIIVSAALHLLLLAVLLFSPAFLGPRKQTLDLPLLTVIPSRLIDEALSGGGSPAPALAPAPTPTPTAPPAATQIAPPENPPPQATVQPPPPRDPPPEKINPKPVLPPEPRVPDKTKSKPKPEKPEKTPDPVEPKSQKPDLNLKRTTRVTPPERPNNREKQAELRAAEQAKAQAAALELAKARQGAINNSLDDLSKVLRTPGINLDSIGPGGGGGPAYANYSQAIKSIFTAAWLPPGDLDDELATVQVKITIARDGRIIASGTSIVRRSGKAGLDRSVETVLRTVRTVPPFPEGSTDEQRTFILNFNLKAKRLIG